MKLTIFTLTHKSFEIPKDPMYQPLQVGSAVHEDLGYIRDDSGENISHLNCYYSELTGFYWIWKNYHDSDYVGTCHYRRYLLNEQEKIFTHVEYEQLLKEYDLITTKRVKLNNSYHFGFSANHNIHALDVTGEVIREIHPDYYDTFVALVNGPETYFGNILVTSKELFDEYADWLFSIFFEVEKRIDMETDEDEYHKRVFGFISEFLLLVWVRVKGLKVYECKVGMIGEKAETREMKERLSEYFKERDIDGAKEYFMKQQKARPDVLMEASDITGELRLSMQIIATADEEKKRYGSSILDSVTDYRELIAFFTKINHVVSAYKLHTETEEDTRFLLDDRVTKAAIWIAVLILPIEQGEKKELELRLQQVLGA